MKSLVCLRGCVRVCVCVCVCGCMHREKVFFGLFTSREKLSSISMDMAITTTTTTTTTTAAMNNSSSVILIVKLSKVDGAG